MEIQIEFKTALGKSLYITSQKDFITSILWLRKPMPLSPIPRFFPILKEVCFQLSKYFAGKPVDFDLPLSIEGTNFQKQVWQELKKIPYAETCSYQSIAKQIRKPLASRAVGTSVGKNPFHLLIPCHRVLPMRGGIGGYAGGQKIKSQLLEMEGALRREPIRY